MDTTHCILNSEFVKKTAEQACLELDDGEVDIMLGEMIALMEAVKTLPNSEYETDSDRRSAALDDLRVDIPTKSPERSELLKNAPAQLNGYIVVPKVI